MDLLSAVEQRVYNITWKPITTLDERKNRIHIAVCPLKFSVSKEFTGAPLRLSLVLYVLCISFFRQVSPHSLFKLCISAFVVA